MLPIEHAMQQRAEEEAEVFALRCTSSSAVPSNNWGPATATTLKEKWSHFDLKSWVIGGTKIRNRFLIE